MKLPLKLGLPLLALLLLALAFTEGREQFVLLLLAMGVALWCAFSLPHPGPRRGAPTLVERSLRGGEGADTEDEAGGPDGPTNGSGGGRTLN